MLPLSHVFGKFGEHTAKKYLEEHNYRIVASHFTTRFGEIDIVAREKNHLIFIEVKTRFQPVDTAPEESFTPYKQRRLFRAIFIFLKKYNLTTSYWQLDLITIHISSDGIELTHWPNVGEDIE